MEEENLQDYQRSPGERRETSGNGRMKYFMESLCDKHQM